MRVLPLVLFALGLVMGCNPASRPPALVMHDEFVIMGEVLRPGLYSLPGRTVTLKMALAAAGWPMTEPREGVLVRGLDTPGQKLIPFDFSGVFTGKSPDVTIESGDILVVGRSLDKLHLPEVRQEARRWLEEAKAGPAGDMPRAGR